MACPPVVYVVDDDRDFLDWCADHLRNVGYGVERFGSGEQFWEADWREDACCLIVDVHLGAEVDLSAWGDGYRAESSSRTDGALKVHRASIGGDGLGVMSGTATAARRRGRRPGFSPHGRISGMELLSRVRRRHRGLPVIFTGASVNLRLVCRAFQQGATDFHEKPVSQRELERSVSAAVARKNRSAGPDQDGQLDPHVMSRVAALTPREFEVLGEMLRGMSIKQLAIHFDISIQTAAKHRARVLNKMRCENEVHVLHLLGRQWQQVFSDIVV